MLVGPLGVKFIICFTVYPKESDLEIEKVKKSPFLE